MSKGIKPLVCIPSPRDIPSFYEAMKTIPADKYWVKYYPQPEAYKILRTFFLANKDKYNYMALIPDDLIPTRKAFDILVSDLEWIDREVLSGICNIDWQRQNIYNVRKSFGTALKDYFITDKNLNELTRLSYIMQVKSTNFSWYFIRRDIVEKIPFKDGIDIEFDKDCERLGIPIYCDLRAKLFHRSNVFGDMNFEEFYVNRKPPITIYDKWNV